MILPEHLKAIAGRWMDGGFRPRLELLPPLSWKLPMPDAGSDDDGTGMWLPAGLVEVGDEVNVAGRWYAVTATDKIVPDYEQPGWAVLFFGAWSQRTGYTSRLYVRDEAARIKTQIGGKP